MPQMAPLSWIYLFMMFITTLMIMNTLNYFSFMYKPHSEPLAPKKIWKW